MNVKNSIKVSYLSEDIKLIQKHEEYIDSYVFKIKNNPCYSETIISNILKKTENNSILFDYGYFFTFLKDLVLFRIKYHMELLINNSPIFSSTSEISNLIYIWKFEQSQEIIKFYKSVLELIESYEEN